MELRDYQKECIETINNKPPGRYLVQMATGLGKTVTFANIPRGGRMLILSHREELVEQPRKYFNCSYGVERAKYHSHGEEVVSASVQTMVKRYRDYSPDDFQIVIVDECHHSAARTYKQIIEYFRPEKTIGFTATPNRADSVRLDDVFQEIIFQRDLRWGIENKYLSPIFAKRVTIGYDLTGVHTRNGDYAPGELDERMSGTEDAIAQAYREHAVGATLIFAASVRHAEEIARRIDGAVVVTGETKDRASIIQAFTNGEIPCIVNCMVFTEGTDIPRVETVIMARPTQSESLYAQMVGRGLRLYPGKEKLTLIDCVGVTNLNLCAAPSLLGIDMSAVPKGREKEIQGDLFDLPDKIIKESDTPESWVKNVRIVNLFAKEQKVNMRDVNFFRMPSGDLVVCLMNGEKITIPAPDMLGQVTCRDGSKMSLQEAIDKVWLRLDRHYSDQRHIWDRRIIKKWESAPATEKQKEVIRKRVKSVNADKLTKGEASMILNRLFGGRK